MCFGFYLENIEFFLIDKTHDSWFNCYLMHDIWAITMPYHEASFKIALEVSPLDIKLVNVT